MSRSRLLPGAGSCRDAAPAPAAGETGQGGSDPRLSGCQQPGGADRAPGSLFMPLLLRNRRFHSNREHHMVTLALQRASPQGASLRPALPAPRRPGAVGDMGGHGGVGPQRGWHSVVLMAGDTAGAARAPLCRLGTPSPPLGAQPALECGGVCFNPFFGGVSGLSRLRRG